MFETLIFFHRLYKYKNDLENLLNDQHYQSVLKIKNRYDTWNSKEINELLSGEMTDNSVINSRLKSLIECIYFDRSVYTPSEYTIQIIYK